MFSVFETSGRQFRVKKGDVLQVNRINAKVGENVVFDKVLLNGSAVGKPFISGAKVSATVKSHEAGEKVIVFTYKRRKNYKKRKGHRQDLTTLEITGV